MLVWGHVTFTGHVGRSDSGIKPRINLYFSVGNPQRAQHSHCPYTSDRLELREKLHKLSFISNNRRVQKDRVIIKCGNKCESSVQTVQGRQDKDDTRMRSWEELWVAS